MCHVWGAGELQKGFRWGKSERQRPLKRPRGKWKDNIKMDQWIGLMQNRDRCRALMNVEMNLRVPLNAGNFLTS
jgi:hypothetical protein